jgi:hypothetical protein
MRSTMQHEIACSGPLLTFAPGVWYPAYGNRARARGLTPLEDQQLGGLYSLQ